jgi:hypothetical protein
MVTRSRCSPKPYWIEIVQNLRPYCRQRTAWNQFGVSLSLPKSIAHSSEERNTEIIFQKKTQKLAIFSFSLNDLNLLINWSNYIRKNIEHMQTTNDSYINLEIWRHNTKQKKNLWSFVEPLHLTLPGICGDQRSLLGSIRDTNSMRRAQAGREKKTLSRSRLCYLPLKYIISSCMNRAESSRFFSSPAID